MTRHTWLRRLPILPSALVLLLGVAANLHAQESGYTFRWMPASFDEIYFQSPDKGNYSSRIDLKIETQGAEWDTNKNPFAYSQEFQFRPWLQYHGIKRLELAFSTAYIKHFAIPAVGTKASTEVRVIAMGTLTQTRPWGSLYEQGRFELRNIRDKGATDWQHIPRVRFRFGQTFKVGESRWNHRIPAYQEIMLKDEKDAPVLDTVRFLGGYGFSPAPRWAATLGFRMDYELKSGKVFDVFFGPLVTVRYQFGRLTSRPLPHPNPDND